MGVSLLKDRKPPQSSFELWVANLSGFADKSLGKPVRHATCLCAFSDAKESYLKMHEFVNTQLYIFRLVLDLCSINALNSG